MTFVGSKCENYCTKTRSLRVMDRIVTHDTFSATVVIWLSYVMEKANGSNVPPTSYVMNVIS